MDSIFAALILKNAMKTYYSYGLLRTIYPDQGETINTYPIFPQLHLTSKEYNRPYAVGNITTRYIESQHEYALSVLGVFRAAKHNIPDLFPYERVEINSHGPYSSVEEFLTINLYLSSYVLAFKFFAFAKHFAPYFINENK